MAVKHREFHYLFRKYVKGENLVIIDHRVVDLDKQQPRKKVIYVKPETNNQQPYSDQQRSTDQYPSRDTIIIGSPEENRRRIAELNESIRLETYRREQLNRRGSTINCWVDENGKKIYTNMPPSNQKMKPCE